MYFSINIWWFDLILVPYIFFVAIFSKQHSQTCSFFKYLRPHLGISGLMFSAPSYVTDSSGPLITASSKAFSGFQLPLSSLGGWG